MPSTAGLINVLALPSFPDGSRQKTPRGTFEKTVPGRARSATQRLTASTVGRLGRRELVRLQGRKPSLAFCHRRRRNCLWLGNLADSPRRCKPKALLSPNAQKTSRLAAI